MPYLADAQRAPRLDNGRIAGEYAYHVDAGLLANYLRDVAVARGVKHVDDTVREVSLAPNGFVDHVTTRNHGAIHADLFVDCSGFRGLLINQALGEPFSSWSDMLLCDRAIAIPVPKDAEHDGIDPFTTATALSAGWSWNVPLIVRDGTGYVYSSHFQSQDDAERELRDFLGTRADGIEARHLRMRVGRNRNSWVKNCVSIGLASGFIEPLEATGIYFIEYAAQMLVKSLLGRSFDEPTIAEFNTAMARVYDDIRDFIMLHYYSNDREDTPFWGATKHDVAIPDGLAEKMEMLRRRLPRREMFAPGSVFRESTYSCILMGMDFWRDGPAPEVDDVDDQEATQVMSEVKLAATALRIIAPDHYRYLSDLRSAAGDAAQGVVDPGARR
jgi:tryptophan halogenase